MTKLVHFQLHHERNFYGVEQYCTIATFTNGHVVKSRSKLSQLEAIEELEVMVRRENAPILPPKSHRAHLSAAFHKPNTVATSICAWPFRHRSVSKGHFCVQKDLK